MPQATEELRAEFPGDDREALDYLASIGIHHNGKGIFYYPEHAEAWPDRAWSAIQYLCDEWDFACKPKEPT